MSKHVHRGGAIICIALGAAAGLMGVPIYISMPISLMCAAAFAATTGE